MWRFLPLLVVISITSASVVDDVSGRRLLKSYNGKYLTATNPHSEHRRHVPFTIQTSSGQDQHWTIVKMNEQEVALKSPHGDFITHDRFDYATFHGAANDWEMLTPVKNEDGSYSFRSKYGKWLSGHKERTVEFMPDNMKCEHWWLESW